MLLSPDAFRMLTVRRSNGEHEFVLFDRGGHPIGKSHPVENIGIWGQDGPFSAGGRWLALYGQHHGHFGFLIYDTTTGAIELALTLDRNAWGIREPFGLDDSAVAVQWPGDNGQPGRVEVRELPSGRIVQQFTWPDPDWKLSDWDGERFYSDVPISESHWDHEFSAMRSLRPPADIRNDPLRRSGKAKFTGSGYQQVVATHRGRGWFAVVDESVSPPTLVDWAIELFAALLKRPINTRTLCQRWQFYNSVTDQPRGPVIRVGGNGVVSPDGRLLAATDRAGMLGLWDTYPWPRWPFAGVAGVVAAVLVLLVGRWRTTVRPFAASGKLN